MKAFLTLLLLAGSTLVYADFKDGLVAHWTFNKADEQVLKDRISGLQLTKAKGIGSDKKVDITADSIRIGRGMMLKASFDTKPELKKELAKRVTIWARLKLGDGCHKDGFILGLLDANKPADWKQQALSIHRRNDNLSMFANSSKGKGFGQGSNYMKVTPDKFQSVAISFDANSKTVWVYSNGHFEKRKFNKLKKLHAFKVFAIGRLKEHDTCEMWVKEIRIYKTAITPEWLEEIGE